MSSYFIGIDGGGTSSKFALITAIGAVLSQCKSGSCNKNNIGFERAFANISAGLDQLFLLTQSQSHSQSIKKSEISAICLCTAGCAEVKDQNAWKQAFAKYFERDFDQHNDANANAIANTNNNITNPLLIEVHNDSVANMASVSPEEMFGMVIIVGTGFIVCGYNGSASNEYRSGGWGPLFGDDASGVHIGMEVLKAVGKYYDVHYNNNNADDDADDAKDSDDQKQEILCNSNNGSRNRDRDPQNVRRLYQSVKQIAGITSNAKFASIIGWAYAEGDKYARIAQFARVALDEYASCAKAKDIIDRAVDALVERVIIILDKLCPIQTQMQNENEIEIENHNGSTSLDFKSSYNRTPIKIALGGSILLLSDLFLNLFAKKLMWTLGGDGRQTLIQLIRPEMAAEVGAALYVKHRHSLSLAQNEKQTNAKKPTEETETEEEDLRLVD